MTLAEDSSALAKRGKGTQAVTAFLDCAIAVSFLISMLIVITGGYKGQFFETTISARSPENSGLVLLALLLLRKLIDRKTAIRDVPLIRIITRLLGAIAPYTARRARVVLGVLVVGYVVIIGAVVCLRHLALQSHGYDLGIFGQTMWSGANGLGLHSSILGRHFLGEHFSPILYLLVPGYSIWPTPMYLVLVQTIALSLAAIPLYSLASMEMQSRNWGLLFSFLYLAYQPMRNVNLYDFHPIALATPILMLAFYLLHKKRNIALLITLCAALACKEEVTEIVFVFGVYAFLVQRRRTLGAALALSGIAMFFALIFHVIPAIREAPYGFAGRYSYLGEDVSSILITLTTRPLYVLRHVVTLGKAEYLWDVFGPLGFLSLASPTHLLLTAPTLIQNLLSESGPQCSIAFQYTSPLTPFVFISAVFGVRGVLLRRSSAGAEGMLNGHRQRSLAAVLLLMTLTLFGKSPAWRIREYRATEYSHYMLSQVLPRIPSQASVSAQGPFVAHLTNRERLYEFPAVKDADYILLDSRANEWPLDEGEYLERSQALMSGHYGVVLSNGSVLLLRRGIAGDDIRGGLPAGFLERQEPRYQQIDGHPLERAN